MSRTICFLEMTRHVNRVDTSLAFGIAAGVRRTSFEQVSTSSGRPDPCFVNQLLAAGYATCIRRQVNVVGLFPYAFSLFALSRAFRLSSSRKALIFQGRQIDGTWGGVFPQKGSEPILWSYRRARVYLPDSQNTERAP